MSQTFPHRQRNAVHGTTARLRTYRTPTHGGPQGMAAIPQPRKRQGPAYADPAQVRYDYIPTDYAGFFFRNASMNSASFCAPSSGRALYNDTRTPPTER